MKQQAGILALLVFSSMALCERVTCTVTVVDVQTAPVSDADVVVYEGRYDGLIGDNRAYFLCDPQKTNKNGQVTLELNYNNSHQVMVVVRKAGYALGWDVLPYQDIASPNVNIILDKPVIFAGRVADDMGNPVNGASIQACATISKMSRLEQTAVIAPVEWMTTHTDKGGRYEWSCFGADVRLTFLVTAPGLKTTYKFQPYPTSSCGYEAGREDTCLMLPKQVAIRGRVVDDKGNGIANTSVIIRRNHQDEDTFRNDYVPFSCITNEKGEFCFEAVPPIRHFLSVRNTDLAKPWVDKTVIVNAADSRAIDNVVIQLETGGIIEITMTDEATHEPIENMYLSFSQEPNNENEWWFIRDLRTNTDGYVKAMLPKGKCDFNFWDERYQRIELELPTIEKGKSAAVSFKLTPNQSCRGVVQSPDEKPAAGVFVKATFGQKVKTDAKGSFQCTSGNLREGMCLIARDIQNNMAVISSIGDAHEPVELMLKSARILKGGVVDTEDRPIPAARITIEFSGPGFLSDCCEEVLTDLAGKFEVKAIPSEIPDGYSFRISVITLNHGAMTYKRLKVQKESDSCIELEPIRMSPAAQTISGSVLNEDGTPVAALPIFLRGDVQYSQTTFSDENGRFQFQRVCEGKVHLQAGIGGEDFKPGRMTAQGGDEGLKIFMGQDRHHAPEVPSLVGTLLTGLEAFGFKSDKLPLLLCVWDYRQRPSRYMIGELVKIKQIFTDKKIKVVLVHATDIEEESFKNWRSVQDIPFEVIGLPEKKEGLTAQLNIKTFPWLILADGQHKVIAEGFSLKELEEKLGGL